MSSFLTPLLQFQRFFLPALLVLLAWAVWRTAFRKDLAVGLALYLGLVIIVDGFLNTGIYIPGLEVGSIRYSELCAVFLLANRPPAVERSPRLTHFLVGLYFVFLLVSALRSEPMMAGISEFRRLIVPQIAAFLVAKRGLGSPEDYRRFFLCLTTLVIIIALFTFWDLFFDRWLMKSDLLSKPEYWLNRKNGRYGSFFLNPNVLAAFIVLVFPVAFVWTLKEQEPWPRRYAWAGLLALIFSLVETQSRGPMLAFGIGLLMLVVGPCGDVSRKRRLGFLAAVVLVFAVFMPGFFQHATERFDSLDRETTMEGRSRSSIWFFTRRIILDHPVGGIGFGEQQFLKAMDAYGFEEHYGARSLDHPHNAYLQVAVYAGIPALAVFLVANGALLIRAARVSMGAVPGGNRAAVFGLAVGITAFLASIFPGKIFDQDLGPIYWVFFGLLLSVVTSASEAKPTVHGSRVLSPRASWLTTKVPDRRPA